MLLIVHFAKQKCFTCGGKQRQVAKAVEIAAVTNVNRAFALPIGVNRTAIGQFRQLLMISSFEFRTEDI